MLREQLKIGDAPVVITVTRMTRQKGIPTLLAAAARVHAVRPEIRFVLVGGWETEGRHAISQAEIERHHPYVQATGSRSDVPGLLRMADIFAFPTMYREGVPRVVLEAGLAGLPIVTTDMPGCNAVVRDGWSGLIVPPRDPARLADAILGLLGDPVRRRALGRQARSHVKRQFGLDLVVDRYVTLYREVLAQSAPAAPSLYVHR